MLLAYALEGLWLYGSLAITPYSSHMDWPLGWVGPANDFVLMSNPVQLWFEATSFTSTKMMYAGRWLFMGRELPPFWATGGHFEWEFGAMAGIQLGFGLLFLGLAIAGLRPLRGSSWPGSEPRAGWWTRLQARYRSVADARAARALARNELLVEPHHAPSMRRKPNVLEGTLHPVRGWFAVALQPAGCPLFQRPPGLHPVRCRRPRCLRSAQGPVVASLLVGDERRDPCDQRGTGTPGDAGRRRRVGDESDRRARTGYLDQPGDHPLESGRDHPSQAVRGSLECAYWVGLALLISWGTGLLMGAIHPLGVLTAIAIVASTGWLIAAAGVFVSSLAKNSTRALAFTFVFLVSLVVVSRSPWSLWLSLVSYQDLHRLWEGGTAPGYNRLTATRADLFLLFVTPVLQSMLAALLTLLATIRLRATWVAT